MDAAGKLKDIVAQFSPSRGVVLELDLARGVLETRPSNPLQAIQVVNATALSRLREALKEAAADERVTVHLAETDGSDSVTIESPAHGEEN